MRERGFPAVHKKSRLTCTNSTAIHIDMPNDPVDRHAYDSDWIASAWTESANDALLANGELTPRPRVARAMELLRLSPGQRLLDIACGRGEVPALASRAGADAVGIDYSDASIAFAAKVRRTLDGVQAGDFSLVQGDACTLPFADASFDRVSMLDIVEHLVPQQLECMFREVRRILRPGGFAVVHTLPNRWVYEIGYRFARLIFRHLPDDPRNPYEKRIHVNEQDVVRLHRMLNSVGLSHRLWLEQHIPAQARWNTGQAIYHDQRDAVYPLMARWPGRLLEGLSSTPLRLLLSNDIFAVLWNGDTPPASAGHLRGAFVERMACYIAGST
jgi:SAM-dependent methyltransferase